MLDNIARRLWILLAVAAVLVVPAAISTAPSEAGGNLRTIIEVGHGAPDVETGRVILRFNPGVPASEQAALHASLGSRVATPLTGLGLVVVDIPAIASARATAEAYDRSGLVDLAQPDALMPLADTAVIPNDLYYTLQWHHDAIDSPEAWGAVSGPSQALITVCDTGVSPSHPDLVGNLRADLGLNTAGRNNDWSPIHYHGTAVAGAAAATGNNQIGVAGVNWSADIIPVRVTDRTDGAAALSAIAACVEYGADQGSAAINVSYTTYTNGAIDPVILAAGHYAEERGSVLVVAAGNSNRDDAPGQDPESILYVAATADGNGKASFSNFGQSVDIAAPGESIVSTYSEVSCRGRNCSVSLDDYAFVSGTSFAAPIVAGAIALTADVRSAEVGALPVEEQAAFLRDSLTLAACDLGTPGEDDFFGAGLLNVHDAAHGSACQSPIPAPTISSVLVTPILATMNVGATEQFSATAVWTDGSTADVTNQVSWTVTAPSIATIDSAGIATALVPGLTSVNATLPTAAGDVLGSAPLLVSEAPPTGSVASVVSIDYSTNGGKNHDRNLNIDVAAEDDLGQPIEGATVEIWLSNADTGQLWTGSSATGSDGTAPFSVRNAPAGTYTTTIVGVTADGFTWDGATPPTEPFVK